MAEIGGFGGGDAKKEVDGAAVEVAQRHLFVLTSTSGFLRDVPIPTKLHPETRVCCLSVFARLVQRLLHSYHGRDRQDLASTG